MSLLFALLCQSASADPPGVAGTPPPNREPTKIRLGQGFLEGTDVGLGLEPMKRAAVHS